VSGPTHPFVTALKKRVKPEVRADAVTYLMQRRDLENAGWSDPEGLDEAEHAQWHQRVRGIGDFEIRAMEEARNDLQWTIEQAMNRHAPDLRSDGEVHLYIRGQLMTMIIEEVAREEGITLKPPPGRG
jgi:hypothetical protein